MNSSFPEDWLSDRSLSGDLHHVVRRGRRFTRRSTDSDVSDVIDDARDDARDDAVVATDQSFFADGF